VRLLLVAVMLSGAVAHADEPWVELQTKNGVTYEKRAVSGSKWLEYRGTTTVPLSPQETVDQIWRGITESLPSTVKKREVLRKSDTEFVVYDQIKAPVVSDRDVTIRISKVVRPDMIEVRFQSDEALGPPPASGYVRIPVVRGAWTLVPAPGGGTRLSYTCYSEPGGSIPAWLARGAQKDQVVLDVERILERLRH
jgi:hypothetical protein